VADQSKENVGAAAGDPQQETSVQEQQKNEGVTSSLQTTERVFPGASASGGREKMQIGGAKKDKTSPDELSLDEWIAGIKKLRRAGKLTEAEASLKAFKQRYPDYPIEKALAQERR
jgi:hypothetical protein